MSDVSDWLRAVGHFFTHLAEVVIVRGDRSSDRDVRYVDALEPIAPGATGDVDHAGTRRVARNVGKAAIRAHHHARILRENEGEIEIDGAEHRIDGRRATKPT